MNPKDNDIKQDFITYLEAHPDERFWQALRNWSGHAFILVADDLDGETEDTFYWEGKK